MSASSCKEMTEEREAEIRLLCRDGGTAQWWVVANELLKEIDRLRGDMREAFHAMEYGDWQHARSILAREALEQK